MVCPGILISLKGTEVMKHKGHLFTTCVIITLSIFFNCSDGKSVYQFATASKGSTYYDVGRIIVNRLRKENIINLKLMEGIKLGSIENCKMLFEKKIDFALAQNDTSIDFTISEKGEIRNPDISTILPLYPEILYLIYKPNVNPSSLRELVKGKKIGMGPENSGTAGLLRILFAEFGIKEEEYIPVHTSFADNLLSNKIDVSCAVTGFNNKRIIKMLDEGGKLFSLGNYSYANNGSAVHGFCMKYPHARSFIIPQNTYGTEPKLPILTVVVDSVLLTRKDMDEEVVYKITKFLLENKQLISIENPILNALTENFNAGILNFPLHSGTRRYLERNEPTYLERYAELIGVLFSIFLASIGSATTLLKWRKQKKKDRIDVYYNDVIAIGREVENETDNERISDAIHKIKALRDQAFELLVAEKLIADESFRIFITLTHDVMNDIRIKKESSPTPR